jgi:hypothetical protein
MTILDMRGVREERFKWLVYHHGTTIRTFQVFPFIAFLSKFFFRPSFYCLFVKFFSRPFSFFWLSALLPFLLFWFGFLSPFVFSLLFRSCFVLVFMIHVVSSLAYPNLLENKRFGCCCCCYMSPHSLAAPSKPPSATLVVSSTMLSRVFFATNGVILRMSCLYTSPQNGRAEHILCTINNMIHSLLFQASIPVC